MLTNNYMFNEIKRRIIENEYKPGDIINEKRLVEEFKVSRTPVREVILKLSHLGLTNIIPRAGTYVAQIDIKLVMNAYEIKIKLESFAAELAAKRITEDEIKELETIKERIINCDFVREYKACISDDQLFHKKIRNASKNAILIEYLDNINDKTARFLRHIQYVIEDVKWFNQSVISIVEAIKQRDYIEAGKEAEKHVEFFLNELSEKFFKRN